MTQWVEKHIVYLPSGNPSEYWNSSDRRGFDYLHKNFLDQGNMEIIGVAVNSNKSINANNSKLCMMRYFVSGESMIYRETSSSTELFVDNYFGDNNYIFSTRPSDMVTLEYGHLDNDNKWVATGHLKIITRDENLFTGKGLGYGTIRPLNNVILTLNGMSTNIEVNCDTASLYGQIVG